MIEFLQQVSGSILKGNIEDNKKICLQFAVSAITDFVETFVFGVEAVYTHLLTLFSILWVLVEYFLQHS